MDSQPVALAKGPLALTNLPAVIGGSPAFDELIPLAKPLLPDIREVERELAQILNTRILSKGHHGTALEESIAEELGVKHAIAVSSCTTGLMLTYQALDLTGEVVVPSFTFMSTVSALRWAGLRPVFADVDLATTNIYADAVRAVLTPETSAIVAVHNFGNPCDIDELQDLADQVGVRLIFDAAHGLGSRYYNRPLGAQGDANVFSLSPTKLVVAGEGGLVTTNDDDLAARVRVGREFGNCGNYDTFFPGLNGRLPEINALLARHSLANLENAVSVRNRMALLYRERLGKVPGIRFQQISAGHRSSYKDVAIVIDPDNFRLTRDELAATLRSDNVESRAYYSPAVHQQRAYCQFAPVSGLSNTETLAANILCLPIWSAMDAGLVSKICDVIAAAHRYAIPVRSKLTERGLTYEERLTPGIAGSHASTVEV
jgi:dTDP-4-amino-4,6-dideoxygalactose transaminase